jgi:hypothetical protein
MAAIDAYTNFAYSKVFAPPTVPLSGTSLSLAAGTSARLPAVPFNAAVWPATDYPDPTNAEIVRVTAVVGDVVTMVRAQEGTVPRTILVGDAFAATITRKTLDDLRDSSNQNSGILPDARLSPNVPLINNANGTYNLRDAGNLTTGTLPDARLSSNVMLVTTPINASNLTTGTLPDARLSTNVPLLNKPSNTFAGALVASGLQTSGDVTTGKVYEYGRTTPQGVAIDVPYSAGLFTASPGMTFQVLAENYVSYWYALLGKMCVVGVNLAQYAIGGTPVLGGVLYIGLPAGIVGSRYTWGGAGVTVPTAEAVRVGINGPSDKIFIQKNDGSAWPVGAGQFLYFHLIFPIV